MLRSIRRLWPGKDVVLSPLRSLLLTILPAQGRLPDFLIIGAQRGGTSWLYAYLTLHPGAAFFSKRELQYFGQHFKTHSLTWYKTQFPFKQFSQGRLVGEKTPEYLYHPHIPARVKSTIPDAKFIALLRNPVDRAYSQYVRDIRAGRYADSFENLIETQMQTTDALIQSVVDNPDLQPKGFYRALLGRGLYADQLERWFALFPREQLMVVRSEDFFKDTENVFQQVTDFLGMDRIQLPEYKVTNARKTEPMKPETRALLRDYFRPHNQRLYTLLGRDMNWD